MRYHSKYIKLHDCIFGMTCVLNKFMGRFGFRPLSPFLIIFTSVTTLLLCLIYFLIFHRHYHRLLNTKLCEFGMHNVMLLCKIE